jgi:hypothetical protein
MHGIERRLRRRGTEHLPRSRHIVHLVEHEFFRRGQPDQQRKMRDQENRDSNHCAPRHLRNHRRFKRLL